MVERWNKCLGLLEQQVGDSWVFDTWFKCITFAGYDDRQHVVTLQVPNTHVYEFLEHYYVKVLASALRESFHSDVRLQYVVGRDAPQSAVTAPQSVAVGMPRRPVIAVQDARLRMENGLRYFFGDGWQWLPGYDRIASWLNDGQGRGLLCVGTPGLGKSVICTRIIPNLIGTDKVTVVKADQLATRLDELLQARILVIDDLGREPVEVKQWVGKSLTVRRPFFELCDAAEKNGNILIIVTNLSTTPDDNPLYKDSIEHRYGPEVISRLQATTRTAIISGTDMRK